MERKNRFFQRTGQGPARRDRASKTLVKAAGFTLIEAILSIVLLGLTAAAVSGLYISGLQALDGRNTRVLVNSKLRSQMEFFVCEDFEDLEDDGYTVNINGKNYTLSTTVVPIDLDGDSNTEDDAVQITVSLAGQSLTTIRVDGGGSLGVF